MIYLNNAATSYPKPKEVIDAVTDALNRCPIEPGRGSIGEGNDILTDCRQEVARLFRINDISRIILTSGSTGALNYVIQGLASHYPDTHCLTSIQEHNSVLRPLNHLKRKGKLKLTYLEPDDFCDITAFEKILKETVSFVVLNHISNVNGTILPVQKIAEICHNYQIPVIVDASQSAGSIDIDLSTWPENIILVFTGHKGLMGPMGTGGFYMGPRISNFEPVLQGGTGIRSELLYQPETLPILYEAGTMNLPGFAGLTAGIKFIQKIGLNEISAHKQHILKHFCELLADNHKIVWYKPPDEDFRSGVVSFNLQDFETEDTGLMLQEAFQIVTRTGLHCAPLVHQKLGSWPKGSVRISCSWFTKTEEIETLANAIQAIGRGPTWRS
ncbi:aminotransferase class V-fold PLP-dependent enzyme [candidate division KSB1 bacterium]|nr:aminotransferase class V-fold PLP-dependent enzyme [candidate division KSB1 bacterium]